MNRRRHPHLIGYPLREVPTEAPESSRAELSTALVEKRAAHAVKMMSRAEKRSKAAQRTLTKWREKVRYYERQAARRTTTKETP